MKYIIKFKKEGKVRFISHLDLQKVFLRLFRIIGVKPRYSNGYNPHPKLSFALPLSLGFASEAEYLEIETEKRIDPDLVIKQLKEYIPSGLTIEYIAMKPDSINKKLASYVDCTEYDITCPQFDNPKDTVKNFLNQDKIVYEKINRKSGKVKEVDIKPMIHDVKITNIDDNNITLTVLLHAGNDTVLNPNVLMTNLFSFIHEHIEQSDLIITRKRVFCNIDGKISDVDQIILK